MAELVMARNRPSQMKWNYEYGLVLQSIFLAGLKTGRDEFCRYVKSMYDAVGTDKGEILTYRENEYNLDQINPGKTLFLLHKKYGEEKYRAALEKLRAQLRSHPRTKSGGFWHKQIYPWQMWLDGLYMQGPFYAQYAAEYGTAADFDDVVRQFTLIESNARDSASGLLYHAWDESRAQAWANPVTGCSPHFWGRALGWYCMALVDTLDFIPASLTGHSEKLAAIAGSLLTPLLNYQDTQSGLWFQVLNKGADARNYLETSASAMFAYFLFKMARYNTPLNSCCGQADGQGSYPDNERIKAAAVQAYSGLLKHKLITKQPDELRLTGICKVAGLGGNPYRDGSFEYYVSEPVVDDDFKGVGPFILASMEYENFTALQSGGMQ